MKCITCISVHAWETHFIQLPTEPIHHISIIGLHFDNQSLLQQQQLFQNNSRIFWCLVEGGFTLKHTESC